jgi:hypothetical protein
MSKAIVLLLLLTSLCLGLSGPALAQTSETRIPETVIVNGQQAQGITVIVNGAVQQFSCSNPQPYITTNQSSSGWACYDQNSGAWLLQSLAPQSTAGYTPSDSYSYYGSPYPYSYYSYYPNTYYPYSSYPYSYNPYFYGPAFGFGYGFGNGFYGYGRHFYGDGRYYGSYGHVNGGSIRGPGGFVGHGGGGFAHGGGGFTHGGGGFAHGGGGFAHGGGGHMGGGGRR